MTGKDRMRVAEVPAVVMFVVACAVGSFYCWSLGFHGWLPYALVSAVPAISSLSMILIAYGVKGLVPFREFRSPLNWTLPVVYVFWTALVAVLVVSGPNGLTQVPPPLRPVLVWSALRPLFITLALGIAVLTPVAANSVVSKQA